MTMPSPNEYVPQIEAELRRLGLLVGPVQPPLLVRSAFGRDEMPFVHWLTKVFLPRLHEAVAADWWPPESHVGTAAIRHFDGQDGYATLIELLCLFDQSIDVRARQSPG